MNFASDNTAGVAPEILAALVAANAGAVPSYGADLWSGRLDGAFSAVFETPVKVVPVATGTAANALALAHLTPPWGAVLCHEQAHAAVDECGAPEFFTAGAKLVPLPGAAGKIAPQTLAAALDGFSGSFHEVQPAALSLSQATEAGTLYAPAEIAALARGRGLGVHMDGARFANAVVALGVAPADLTWRAGVDVLSFGATKNGAMLAEAVVFFDPARAADFAFRQKRAGHVISKARFVSAQLLAYLEDGLWLRLAGHANGMARRLAEGLSARGIVLAQPLEANELFVHLPPPLAAALKAKGASFYDWSHSGPDVVRLVTSWATTVEEVDRFLAMVGEGA